MRDGVCLSGGNLGACGSVGVAVRLCCCDAHTYTGIFLDYCRQKVAPETMRLLLQLAEEMGLANKIKAMFAGQKINVTENRAVLHVALRARPDQVIEVDGKNVVPEVHAVLSRMKKFAHQIRTGR